MQTQHTTSVAAAANDEMQLIYTKLDNPEALADSLRNSASYLRSCAEKHDASGSTANEYKEGQRVLQRLADEVAKLGDTAPGFVRYRNALYSLDYSQLASFELIKIDYQTRLGGYFNAVTTKRLYDDLVTMMFALEAIDRPQTFLGVGGGFSPRYRLFGNRAVQV